MKQLEFIKAKYPNEKQLKSEPFSSIELAKLIKEYEEIRDLMRLPYKKKDDRVIDVKEWIKYNEAYNAWSEKEYEDDMTKYMSQPNRPNCIRANND